MRNATVRALVKVLFSTGPGGKTAAKPKYFHKVNPGRTQGQSQRSAPEVPQVASAPGGLGESARPHLRSLGPPDPVPVQHKPLPLPFPARRLATHPLHSSRPAPGPAPRSGALLSPPHPRLAEAGPRPRPPRDAPRPSSRLRTLHTPRSRRRLGPRQCPHRTRSRAPPRNTPPARGPLPHMMPAARSVR